MTLVKEGTRIGNASIGTRQRQTQLQHLIASSSLAMEMYINEFCQLDANAYEGRCRDWDFHVRKERGRWYVDLFNARIDDPYAAHCGSETFNGFQDAIDFVLMVSSEMRILSKGGTTTADDIVKLRK